MATIFEFPAPRDTSAAADPGANARADHGADHGADTCAADPANAGDLALPCTAGRRCEYALGDMARLLGLGDYAPRTIITYLRAMARDAVLPLPKTPRLHGGRIISGADAIHRHSRWDAERVDAWLARHEAGDPCPPAPPALRDAMAQRAVALAAGA